MGFLNTLSNSAVCCSLLNNLLDKWNSLKVFKLLQFYPPPLFLLISEDVSHRNALSFLLLPLRPYILFTQLSFNINFLKRSPEICEQFKRIVCPFHSHVSGGCRCWRHNFSAWSIKESICPPENMCGRWYLNVCQKYTLSVTLITGLKTQMCSKLACFI